MANYKRKRPREHSISMCGIAHCRYDMVHMQTNGYYRYPAMFWKKAEGGRRVWRYWRKNVDPRDYYRN